MKWIFIGILCVYLLIGLIIEAYLDGYDAAITFNSIIMWLLWPVIVISAFIAVTIKRNTEEKRK